MKYKAILFDLDGTLLPMDNDIFTKGYFKELTTKLSPLGLEPDKMIEAVWGGTKAMIKNDGSKINESVFWETFAQITGKDINIFKPDADKFYLNEFANAKKYTQENPLAVDAVKAARNTGAKVVCATNPLFPLNGQLMRLSWIGLKKDDFDYITSYESESYCKPNPMYYSALCEKINVDPKDCLLIGNDVKEDMLAASSIGIDCYFVTDCAILSGEWNGKRGTFREMLEYLENL